MAASRSDLLKGTLDLLILRTLELEPRHGLGVADRIAQITGGAFTVKPGSLFPALHRLEAAGYLRGSWGESDNARRARFYQLTAAGRRRLDVEKENWTRIVVAVSQVLDAE